MFSNKIILIAGPTASGKSALALDLARKNSGVIINADAMQIYAGLPILTAQPSAAERAEIPHELYGVIDPSERSSAGKWRNLAVTAIQKTIERKRTPILVGGTGMYFRSLLGGLAEIPDIPDEIRARTQVLYGQLGEERFRSELAKRDTESASRIARNDRQRLTRAFEVVEHTGKPLSEWQNQGPETKGQRPAKNTVQLPKLQPLATDFHLLMPPRDKLYAACDKRFTLMIEHGAVEEVRQFLTHDLDPELPAMKTLGLREIAAYLRNEITLPQAIAQAQQMTRNYAKRQMTWFRNQGLSL